MRSTKLLGGDVAAVVVASLDDFFGMCDERRRVFYGTDDYVAGAELMGLSRSWLLKREDAQLAVATDVVAVSPELATRWSPRHAMVHVIPNGCDTAIYREHLEPSTEAVVDLQPPIAGLVGHISDRLDLALLEAIADQGDSLLLVGPTTPALDHERFARLVARPSVRWVGAKPYDTLPAYLQLMKVGVTPYAQSDFNRGSFPLKTLEYLAAGRGVVTTDLPAARWLDTDLIAIASSPESFADAVHAALHRDEPEGLETARRNFAAQHSWDSRARDFARLLGLDVG